MLAFLFTLAILASLGTTALIGLDVLPASPLVISVVFSAHALFALGFFRGYSGYRSLHRLVLEGRGELYDIAVTHRIETGWFREFREHFRLRRLEGLALCGLSSRALEAAEAHRYGAGSHRGTRLAAVAAEAEANLDLGRLGWAALRLEEARDARGYERHPGIRAMRGRLAHLRGASEQAVSLLEQVDRAGEWPLGAVTQARNNAWLGDALAAANRVDGARAAYGRAVKAAPKSYWGQRAKRALSLLS